MPTIFKRPEASLAKDFKAEVGAVAGGQAQQRDAAKKLAFGAQWKPTAQIWYSGEGPASGDAIPINFVDGSDLLVHQDGEVVIGTLPDVIVEVSLRKRTSQIIYVQEQTCMDIPSLRSPLRP